MTDPLPLSNEQPWRRIIKEAIDKGLLSVQLHGFQIPVVGVVELRGGSKPNGINLLLEDSTGADQ